MLRWSIVQDSISWRFHQRYFTQDTCGGTQFLCPQFFEEDNMTFLLALLVLAQSPTYTWEVQRHGPEYMASTTYTTQIGEWTCEVEVFHARPLAPPKFGEMALAAWTKDNQPHSIEAWIERSTFLAEGKLERKDNRLFLEKCAAAIPSLPNEVKLLAPNYFNERRTR